MRIAFYPSFRSLDHPNSSGLVSIGRDILAAMQAEGHEVIIPLKQSMEWIYREFWRWPETLRQGWLAERKLRQFRPDCWLTYHSYYRGPDLIGPTLTRRHHLPYFLLAPSYATKYRKQMATWPGFQLNRRAILDADMVFANKLRDIENLKRILPPEKITYIHPGIKTASFSCNQEERIKMREQLGVNGKQVVVTAAMMRPGVKEDGIAFVIECCAKILAQVPALHLLIVGDGPGRPHLSEKAEKLLPGVHTFTGRLAPEAMAGAYQAGDVFAFPGISEALGMVYLEAQCCGLPVVATSHDGAPEVVADQETGIIVPPFSVEKFGEALVQLLNDHKLRKQYSLQARKRVLAQHDMQHNYRLLLQTMEQVIEGKK